MAESNNMKIKDYFKQAENIIENNLKIFLPCMLIYMLFSVGITVISMRIDFSGVTQLYNDEQLSNLVLVSSVASFTLGVLFSILEIYILRKIDTGLDFVEEKRVNASVSKIIGRMILAYLMFFGIIFVIVGIISIVVALLIAINQALAMLAFVIMIIPMMALSVLMPIAMYYLNFEIIFKNTKIIEGFKAVYKNVMKSKNKTLSKMLVGAGVQILAFTVIQLLSATSITAGQSYFTMFIISALQAAYVVYFLVYYFIVYMSSEV